MLGLGLKLSFFSRHFSWNWIWFTIRRIKHMHIQITLVSIYLHLIILELLIFYKKLCIFSTLIFFVWCSLFPQCELFHLNHLQKFIFDVNPLFLSFPIPSKAIVYVLFENSQKKGDKMLVQDIISRFFLSPWNKILS